MDEFHPPHRKLPPFSLSIVVAAYNEEESIDLFFQSIDKVLKKCEGIQVEIIFVNDGSQDRTLEKLFSRQKTDARLKIVDLSRNFGKEAALSAGLQASQGQVVVPMDVDLQDPPELILQMLEEWQKGYEVVLARRVNRDSDSWWKRSSAGWFYWLHNKIAEFKIPENVGDFRLMDRVVVDSLREFPESRRFMKGLLAWAGFRTTYVDYTRPDRIAGTTKFNAWKLWNFALEGITSFSTVPLRVWSYLGFFVAVVSILKAIQLIVRTLIYGVDLPGYASLMVAIMFLGGLQLIGIGVLGEYLGRTYIESKRRPVYLVRKVYSRDDKSL